MIDIGLKLRNSRVATSMKEKVGASRETWPDTGVNVVPARAQNILVGRGYPAHSHLPATRIARVTVLDLVPESTLLSLRHSLSPVP